MENIVYLKFFIIATYHFCTRAEIISTPKYSTYSTRAEIISTPGSEVDMRAVGR
jgi:hypothetical protein